MGGGIYISFVEGRYKHNLQVLSSAASKDAGLRSAAFLNSWAMAPPPAQSLHLQQEVSLDFLLPHIFLISSLPVGKRLRVQLSGSDESIRAEENELRAQEQRRGGTGDLAPLHKSRWALWRARRGRGGGRQGGERLCRAQSSRLASQAICAVFFAR